MKAGLNMTLIGCLVTGAAVAAHGQTAADWRGARIRPVSAVPGRHTLHPYYMMSPESPDGKRVVFFASTDKAASVGSIVVQDRETGAETVLADNVRTEDAHRAALQQWVAGGRLVAYHEVRDGRWQVVVVDVATKEKRIVAKDRQLGFAQANGDLLPMYGCHWNPGPFRDLYLWDARTGETSTPVTAAAVEAKYAAWIKKEFGGHPISIAFPTLSPDLKRVFFKLAAGSGGTDWMARGASHRQGTVVFDFEKGLIWQRDEWGHPAWLPDSRHLIEMDNQLFDVTSASAVQIPNVPALRGMHPNVAPDGRLWVTDGMAGRIGGSDKEWAVMVADLEGKSHEVLHRCDNTGGAQSWRGPHPHPVFSADGNRIYYNVSAGEFTRLYVADKRPAGQAEVLLPLRQADRK